MAQMWRRATPSYQLSHVFYSLSIFYGIPLFAYPTPHIPCPTPYTSYPIPHLSYPTPPFWLNAGTAQLFKSSAMLISPANQVSSGGKELRIARWDESLKPYSQEDFLHYYMPESAWFIWQDAVTYKDAAGNVRHVLVRIGNQKRWGLIERISQESDLLAGMVKELILHDDPLLDLRAIVGCDLDVRISFYILAYLCGYDSIWWEVEPTKGALAAAAELGLKRLVFVIVKHVFWGAGHLESLKSSAMRATLLPMQATLPLSDRGGGEELRIARWDKSLKPYSQEEFRNYYTPESAWIMWQDAVTYKDAAGNVRHVLVRIGNRERWGLVERLSQESVVLAGMLSCDDDSPLLDLQAIVGCDLDVRICEHILDYLCGYDSIWWEVEPTIGALDAADKLGLQKLLSWHVRPTRYSEWCS